MPVERIEKIENAKFVLLGMGRVGRGAYNYLVDKYNNSVVGVDKNYERATQLRQQGIRCVHGDASDRDFWEQAGVANCELLLVSLSNHREQLPVVKLANELKELEALGCVAFNFYTDVGRGFAESVLQDQDGNN